MTRYAILEHQQAQQVHWDFFIERDDVLQAWRLDELPRPNTAVPCSSAPDHRLVYLDYEGPLTGDRGKVIRWDWGEYQLRLDTPTEVVLAVAGQRLCGLLRLERNSPAESQWRLTYRPASP
jgi:hypothetical protein